MREKTNRWLSRMATVVALFGAGYYWMVGGEHSRASVHRLQEERSARQAELAGREAELATISAWADSLVAEPWAIERVARERYGFVREGEVLVRFVGPRRAAPAGSGSSRQ